MTASIEELVEDFTFIDNWEDRYRYVIELGNNLAPYDDEEHNDQNKVQGCVSQVWLTTQIEPAAKDQSAKLFFSGDSDAHIVRGLIAILLRIYSGKTAEEILAIEPQTYFQQLGLQEHLSPQRSNGLASMVKRIQQDAQNAS